MIDLEQENVDKDDPGNTTIRYEVGPSLAEFGRSADLPDLQPNSGWIPQTVIGPNSACRFGPKSAIKFGPIPAWGRASTTKTI